MNLPVFVGGITATFLLLVFIVELVADGIWDALKTVGFLILLAGGVIGMILFWAWIARFFA